MKNIIIINHNNETYQAQSYFAINFASCLAKKNKKILIFSTILSPKYFDEIKTKTSINKEIKTIVPFELYLYQKNLDILIFGYDTNQNLKIKSIDEVLRLLKKQINLINDKYEYIVIDFKNQWSSLDDYFIKDQETTFINFLEYKTNTKFEILNNFNNFKTRYNVNILKYPFVISNYDGFNKDCLHLYNDLKTQYKINQLFYFNESFDQPINFIRHKPWSRNSIILDTLIEKNFNN